MSLCYFFTCLRLALDTTLHRVTGRMAYANRAVRGSSKGNRAHRETRYPNVTWHIILSVYLLTLVEITEL